MVSSGQGVQPAQSRGPLAWLPPGSPPGLRWGGPLRALAGEQPARSPSVRGPWALWPVECVGRTWGALGRPAGVGRGGEAPGWRGSCPQPPLGNGGQPGRAPSALGQSRCLLILRKEEERGRRGDSPVGPWAAGGSLRGGVSGGSGALRRGASRALGPCCRARAGAGAAPEEPGGGPAGRQEAGAHRCCPGSRTGTSRLQGVPGGLGAARLPESPGPARWPCDVPSAGAGRCGAVTRRASSVRGQDRGVAGAGHCHQEGGVGLGRAGGAGTARGLARTRRRPAFGCG